MALSKEQIKDVEDTLKASIRNKFKTYKPEADSKPFQTRLLGKDRLALYAFIHSLNTNFGTTVFEPVARTIAQTRFSNVEVGKKAPKKISSEAQRTIQGIMDDLISGTVLPDKNKEIEQIKKVANEGTIKDVKLTKIDVYFESKDTVYMVDLKAAKPNFGEFKGFKRTLLEWTAAQYLEEANGKDVVTLVAIPYNPYEPEPYNRWTMRGMLDLKNELKVADEFWDFLGGKNTYKDLLDCFERVGIELRDEIDDYFKRFNKK